MAEFFPQAPISALVGRIARLCRTNKCFAVDSADIIAILYFSNKGIQYALWTEEDYAIIIHSELPMEKILEMAVSVKK